MELTALGAQTATKRAVFQAALQCTPRAAAVTRGSRRSGPVPVLYAARMESQDAELSRSVCVIISCCPTDTSLSSLGTIRAIFCSQTLVWRPVEFAKTILVLRPQTRGSRSRYKRLYCEQYSLLLCPLCYHTIQGWSHPNHIDIEPHSTQIAPIGPPHASP